MTLEIFSSSELFLRTPHVVESVDHECPKLCEHDRYTESTFALVYHHICHWYTDARSVSREEKMIRSIQKINKYSHSTSEKKIIFYRKNFIFFLLYFLFRLLKYFYFSYAQAVLSMCMMCILFFEKTSSPL